MSFVQRLINTTFTLANGTFPNGKNTVKLTGLRTSVHISTAGAPSGSLLQMRINGMTPDTMNALSTLGMQISFVPRDTVTIEAGTAAGMSTVYSGQIIQAYVDFQAMPDVALQVTASTIASLSVIPLAPTSYPGSVDAAQVLQTLAEQAGLDFENNGVSVQLSSPYFYGDVRSQIASVADAAGIGWIIDRGVLAIWPKNGTRAGDAVVLSPATGLLGYPTYSVSGILLKTLYNPDIKFRGSINVKDSFLPDAKKAALLARPAAAAASFPKNGIWTVTELDHDLESMVPGGSWFTNIAAYNSAYTPTIQPPVR